VALVAIPTAALVALVGWRAALPPVAASEAPELPAEEIAWFVQTGCTTCHTVSVYNLNTIAPRAPDLSTAVVDVRHRFGRSLEDFLREPTGTMAIVLNSLIRLTPEQRAEAVRRLEMAYERHRQRR
jgi:hypothetical protein